MSRYCGTDNPEQILRAASEWRRQALEKDGSVFSGKPLWTLEHLKTLEEYFVNRPDETEATFYEKLSGQLAETVAATKQLAAEMLWVMLLCPSNITADRKREDIRRVWSWSGEPLPEELVWLSTPVLQGVGSAGQSFNYYRWKELTFFIRWMIAFKELPENEREKLLTDGRALAEWLSKIPEGGSRQLRAMVLYLLFPDTFERIFGGTDRREIVQRFTGKPKGEVDALSPIEIDEALAQIRKEQQEKYGTTELDFYVPPLVGLWKTAGFKKITQDIRREHVLAALREIDKDGIPPDAKSTGYDLIHEDRHYPPKLVLSLASKYANGETFDRSLFTGGESSPAFALLRELGFHIESKDFVESLIGRFLQQAQAADDLSTRDYPRSYRGLKVSVSFGKGNFSKIPWISFLGYEQKTSEGIYPVYLYYQDQGILILAYGVSETTAPPTPWDGISDSPTIKTFFRERFGKVPERYGDSFVFTSYLVPDDIAPETMTKDLDLLIAKYHQQFAPTEYASQASAAPTILVAAEPSPIPLAPAYTVEQALRTLFISPEQFRDILDTWERKKNIIVQGPPGVGKSFFARRLAYALMLEEAKARVEAVQFHQTYAYEDFVQGYRPEEKSFVRRNGIFYQFCEDAREDPNNKYVFIVDEINRGNLSKILGELMMLIEPDKRSAEWAIPLTYSRSGDPRFYVPSNVYLLGLMNTADRSLSMVDYALRRRFAFTTLNPGFQSANFAEKLREAGASDKLIQKIVGRMTKLNSAIAKDLTNLGPGYCIGHSFFCDTPKDRNADDRWYEAVVMTEIAPLLAEYCFDEPEKAKNWISDLLAD